MPDGGSPIVRRHVERGGRAYLVRSGWLVEANGPDETDIAEIRRIPITIGGLARHNVANALAAAGGARGLGASIAEVRDGLHGLPARRGQVARPAEPVPPRVEGDHRGLRPQRGRHLGRAGRGRGHRRRGGRPGRTDHGHHRDRGRPARRHAPGDRQDRRRASAAGRRQADPRLPARPDARVGRRRVAGRRRRRRRRSDGGADLRLRDRRAAGRTERRVGAVRRAGRATTRLGSSCSCATPSATRCSTCSRRSAPGRST